MHLHFHIDKPVTINVVVKDIETINNKLDTIMSNQAEVAAQLRTVIEHQRKTQGEIATLQSSVDELKAKVEELQGLLAAGGEVTQELKDAADEVSTLAQQIDDQIPEVVAPPTDPA